MQQIIANLESGLNARNAINGNFTELYNSLILPIKLQGVGFNTNVPIPANTMVLELALIATSGTPTVRIGKTPNGQEYLADKVITGTILPITIQDYFQGAGFIYITTGTGAISVRIDVKYNYF